MFCELIAFFVVFCVVGKIVGFFVRSFRSVSELLVIRFFFVLQICVSVFDEVFSFVYLD